MITHAGSALQDAICLLSNYTPAVVLMIFLYLMWFFIHRDSVSVWEDHSPKTPRWSHLPTITWQLWDKMLRRDVKMRITEWWGLTIISRNHHAPKKIYAGNGLQLHIQMFNIVFISWCCSRSMKKFAFNHKHTNTEVICINIYMCVYINVAKI